MTQLNTEAIVVAVLEDLLNRDSMGLDENFFECGGNSLMAARALSLLKDQCGVELSLQSFFDRPTARGLHILVEAALLHQPRSGTDGDDDRDYDEQII